jgi:hypothetical protein
VLDLFEAPALRAHCWGGVYEIADWWRYVPGGSTGERRELGPALIHIVV